MSAVLAWALAAAALLLWPGRRARRAVALTSRAEARSSRAEALTSRTGAGSPRMVAVAAGCAVALACLVVLGLPGGVVVAALAGPLSTAALRAVQRRPVPMPLDESFPLALDLVAAALQAGQPLSEALALAASAAADAPRDVLLRVAGLLRLGAAPAQAWAVVDADGPLGPVAAAATRSASSGIRLAAAFERLAAEVRAELAARAAVRAHRAGVAAMGPLAACFLPSFVCLGIVPVVVGIARTALGTLP